MRQKRQVAGIMEVYAHDKRSLLLLMEEASKPKGESEIIEEHGLSPPPSINWSVMTSWVRYCAEVHLAEIRAKLSNELTQTHALTPRSSASPPRGMPINEYRKLVVKAVSYHSDDPNTLLTLPFCQD